MAPYLPRRLIINEVGRHSRPFFCLEICIVRRAGDTDIVVLSDIFEFRNSIFSSRIVCCFPSGNRRRSITLHSDGHQILTAEKRHKTHLPDTGGNRNGSQVVTPIDRIIRNDLDIVEENAAEIAPYRILVHLGDIVRKGIANVLQTGRGKVYKGLIVALLPDQATVVIGSVSATESPEGRTAGERIAIRLRLRIICQVIKRLRKDLSG